MAERGRTSYASGLGFGVLSFASVALLGVVSSIAIARLYGAEVLGAYALALAPATALSFFASAREQAGLVRELSRLEPRDPHATALLAAVALFSTGLTLVVGAVICALTWVLYRGPIGQPDLFDAAVVLVLSHLAFSLPCWNLDTVMAAFRAGRTLYAVRLTQAVAFLVLAIAAAGTDSEWGLVAATAGSFAIGLVHRLAVIHRFLRLRVSRAELREGLRALPSMVRFGVKIAPGAMAGGVSLEAGTWILGATTGLVQVGAYNRAWTLARRLLELQFRVSEMLFPTLLERRAAGDDEGFDRALVDTMRYSAIGMLLAAAVAGGACQAVMRVFGPEFEEAAAALAILFVVPALATVAATQGQALLAADRPLTATAVTVVRAIVTVAATVPLASWLGAAGVGIALLAGYVVEIGAKARLTAPYLSAPLPALWPLRGMAAVLLAYAAGVGAGQLVMGVDRGILGLLGACAASTLAYVGVLLVVGGHLQRDRDRAGAALARVRAALVSRRVPA